MYLFVFVPHLNGGGAGRPPIDGIGVAAVTATVPLSNLKGHLDAREAETSHKMANALSKRTSPEIGNTGSFKDRQTTKHGML